MHCFGGIGVFGAQYIISMHVMVCILTIAVNENFIVVSEGQFWGLWACYSTVDCSIQYFVLSRQYFYSIKPYVRRDCFGKPSVNLLLPAFCSWCQLLFGTVVAVPVINWLPAVSRRCVVYIVGTHFVPILLMALALSCLFSPLVDTT